MSWNPKEPLQSPCGADFPHYFCRQFGYCLFGKSPDGHVVDSLDRINAYIMAGTTWAFFIFAALSYNVYKPGDFNMAYDATYPEASTYFAYVLIANGVLCLFPTYYSITISNIFKAKVFANAVWNTILVLGAVYFLEGNIRGVAAFELALGWSVSMFVTTGAKEAQILCYPAGVVFTGIAVMLAMPASLPASVPYFFAASYLFGFMCWSSLEGYPHTDNFGVYPDVRSWKWNGPEIHYNPKKDVVPQAWPGLAGAAPKSMM